MSERALAVGDKVRLARGRGSTTGKIERIEPLCSTSPLWDIEYGRVGLAGGTEKGTSMAIVIWGVGALVCPLKDLERVPVVVTPAHREAAFIELCGDPPSHEPHHAIGQWWSYGKHRGTAHNWDALDAEARRIAESE